jgi:hypothetical protein
MEIATFAPTHGPASAKMIEFVGDGAKMGFTETTTGWVPGAGGSHPSTGVLLAA